MGFGPTYVICGSHPANRSLVSKDSLCCGVRMRVAYITAKSKKQKKGRVGGGDDDPKCVAWASPLDISTADIQIETRFVVVMGRFGCLGLGARGVYITAKKQKKSGTKRVTSDL